jgi:hypothetical protein
MKKMLVCTSIALFLCSSIDARLRYEAKNGTFYSEGAPKNVNQEEYNELATELSQWLKIYHPDFIFYPIDQRLQIDFILISQLKKVGTPAALRLIHDLEKLIKETKNDLNRIYGK